MQQLIQDKYFRVEIDKDASSPNPQTAVWRGQHQCVIEGFAFDDEPPSRERCGEIIIKHQLGGDRGHYSVLDQAFIKLDCAGFPHSVISQVTRHHESHFLVQSSRYTGDRFVAVAEDQLSVEEVFYFRPTGIYKDTTGKSYEYTEEDKYEDIELCIKACNDYAYKVDCGCPYEMARDVIPYNFRQNFCIAGTLKNLFHVLDQRTKADAQLEIRTWAEMVMEKLLVWSPELATWYRSDRYAKAKLAP